MMKEKRFLVALGALSAALAACSSEVGTPGDAPGDDGVSPGAGTGTGGAGPSVPGAGNGPVSTAGSTATNGGSGTGTGTAGTGSGTTAGTGSGLPVNPVGDCKPGIPVTTQIPKLMNRQYENVVRDLLGITDLNADDLPGDFTGAMTASAWEAYKKTAAKIATQVMSGPNKSKFISCDAASADCLTTTISTFGRKAFRRALRAEEVTAFLALNSTTPKGTPDQVAGAILEAFLLSPSFLLLPELATDADGMEPDGVTPRFKLSPQEVAAKLSFLLWGSIPDEALNMAADANQLQTPEQIREQAVRMLAVREKAGSFISGFHSEWAQMNSSAGHWFKGDHDATKFPGYKPEFKSVHKAELDAFFQEVAYSNGTFQDLLLSNVAFINKDNAAIYGLNPADYGAEFKKETVPGRPGMFTRAGFLSSYSNFGASSPILRGAFLSIELLALPVGAPDPANLMQTAEGVFMTQRDYVEALTEKPGSPCAGCHAAINPPGYVLEKFDAIGKVQAKDPLGGEIDASVTTATVLFGTDVAGNAIRKEISTPEQLMEEIAKMPMAQERYAKAWVSYAYGRSMNAYDQCVVDKARTQLAAGGYTILNLLADLTQADSFRLRVRGAL